jgi:hypothetical protein
VQFSWRYPFLIMEFLSIFAFVLVLFFVKLKLDCSFLGGATIAPIALGLIGEHLGMKLPYLVAAVCTIIACALIVHAGKKYA